MKADRSLFSQRDREAEAASIARARGDIEAGRFVDHEEVAKWLRTWGTDDEYPVPREWLE